MSKIVIACLTVAAFAYAVWLLTCRRPLPNPKHYKGLRRRFVLAVLLFVGLLASGMKNEPQITCYVPPPIAFNESIGRHEIAATFKAVWRTLDPNRSEEFRNKLEAVAGDGKIRKRTADMLAVAFSELAYHKERTRGKGRMLECYNMSAFGATLYSTRENAFKQLELLAKVRESGAIDAETGAKAHAVLAKELEMLHQAKRLDRTQNWQAERQLMERYKAGKIAPGDVASVTAAMIVEMEDGQVSDLTPAKRLAAMKKQIEILLKGEEGHGGGPPGNDWMDPALQPNVYAILEKAVLLERGPTLMCYQRARVPVQARSDELKKLQQELLDKNVRAGVLDVEVADKAALATAKEPEADYATEKDIQAYQKKLRRAVRLMYRRGELPSSFVEELERAADIEIIAFNPTKALRNDMRYYLRSGVWGTLGDEVLKALQKRKLVPAARSHRLIMAPSRLGPRISKENQKKLDEFAALIDSDEVFELTGDKDVNILQSQIPSTDTQYRLKMRRICRALVKTRLVDKQRVNHLEEVIGIPIVATLEGK